MASRALGMQPPSLFPNLLPTLYSCQQVLMEKNSSLQMVLQALWVFFCIVVLVTRFLYLLSWRNRLLDEGK